MKPGVFLFLLLASASAYGAKLPVSLVTPTENVDGSPLTNLAAVRIEWGTCNGSDFGTLQAGINVPVTQPGVTVQAFIYPTGLKPVCVRAFALNASGTSSDASLTGQADGLPKLGKPVTLP